MQWSEVKEHYPSQWVLKEAINATTEGNKLGENLDWNNN